MKKEKGYLRDNFGKLYYVELIPMQKAMDIIRNTDVYEVVKLAYHAMIPGYTWGYCVLDLEEGKLKDISLAQNEQLIADRHLIYIYGIDSNFLSNAPWELEDLLTEDEERKVRELLDEGYDCEEAFEKIGVDFDERMIEWIAEDAEIDYDEIYSAIDNVYDSLIPE